LAGEVINNKTKAKKVMKDYFNEVETYFKLNDFDQAISRLKQIIKVNPKDKMAFKLLGNAYFLKNDYKKALNFYKKAVKIDPDFAELHNNIGLIYSDQLKIKESIKHLNKAIALKPDFENAFYNRALVFEKIGEYHKAIADYTKVIDLNPDDFETVTRRRNLVNSLGIYEIAIDYQFAKLDIAGKSKKNFELIIVIPQVFFHSLDHFDRISAIIDFVNKARELKYGKHLSANAWEVYFLDYYVSQIHNGGINQFIANSELDPFMVKNIQNGLSNIGAKQNLALFNELLSKNIILEKDETGRNEKEVIEGYVKFAERIRHITEPLNNRFYKIEKNESISDLSYLYIGNFDNLELFPKLNP
jgi:tetratricopeptide (TPR) repeat protein